MMITRPTNLFPLAAILKQDAVQSVVHDLRTPMTVIKGYLQMLLSGLMGEMSLEQRELLERSMAPLDDLILLTENLLHAATLEKDQIELHLEPTDLDKTLAETLDFYQLPFSQRKMQIYRNGNTLGLQLNIDPFWFKRILHNLIWNAYKYTPDQGRVKVDVARKGLGLELAIEDTGRGIPADKLNDIFNKFAQATPSEDHKIGTGLGLWICKRIMELHGGQIRAQSTEGRGSRFILSFPPRCIL